ncbi:DUF748 domain-containing protein [Methylomagnum ishizawai]|uniref:DUF748 domain-containing protein n=1 Tax=Methylomagnum ishizawai TaxID=1760988 RepID=UPI001C33715F|nr:DUF748 domain-containing protein [Methylomagnum ishizawai]BBL77234.1 hypothetical protein MishRS11D_43320 [Methylomagnum ishizawai]
MMRIARWASVVAVCVALYALLGFFGVPWVVRSQLPKLAAERTTGIASVDEVRFNPFTCVLELRDFELRRDARPPPLGFASLTVDFGFWRSLAGTLQFDAIGLSGPFAQVVIDREGRLNLAELFPGQGGHQATPPFHIGRLTVKRGRLGFEDLSRAEPLRQTLFPIGLELSDFSLRAEGEASPYRLTAATAAHETLTVEGRGSAAPLSTEGRLQLKNLKADTLTRYAPGRFGFVVKSGTLDLDVHYRIGGDPVRAVVGDGRLVLGQLRLADRDSGRVPVEIPSIQVLGIAANTAQRTLSIRSVESTGGRLEAALTPAGRFDLSDWLPPSGPGGPQGPMPGKEAAAWSVAVGGVTLDQYTVGFEDRRPPGPVALSFTPLRLEFKEYATNSGKPVRVALNSGLNGSGRIGVAGEVAPESRSADLAVDLEGLNLPRFQPYLDRFARLDLVKGALDVHGRVSLGWDGEKPVLGYQGDARLAGLETRLRGQDQALVSWKGLDFSDLDFQSEPARLHVADIAANGLYARIVVKPDRTLNLAEAVAPTKPEQSKEAPVGKPMAFAIDQIRLEHSQADFTDQSIQPNFSTAVQDLHGTVEGLDSKPGQSAKMRLEGQVGPYAPAKIEGKLNLFRPAQFADVHMHFSSVDMSALSPYSGKFAGYRIKMGKMSLDLDYHLKDRRLDSDNKIVLTRLVLGEPVPDSKAPDLPLHLAIALLKDSQGKIDLDLPIRGDLSKPKVSFPGLVKRVFFGLVRKAVASPFNLLAKLAGGGGGAALRYVDFSPSAAELRTEQVDQLAALAKALRERPALYLRITGVAGPERDRRALAEQDLIDRLKIAKLMEEGRPTTDPEALRATVLSQSEYQRYLARLYRRETGQTAPASDGAMRRALLDPAGVSRTRLRLLAQARTRAIRDYLVNAEGLKPDRMFPTDVRLGEGEGPLVRSELGLGAL